MTCIIPRRTEWLHRVLAPDYWDVVYRWECCLKRYKAGTINVAPVTLTIPALLYFRSSSDIRASEMPLEDAWCPEL